MSVKKIVSLLLALALLCGMALAMLIWKRREENDPEEIDEENMEDFAE